MCTLQKLPTVCIYIESPACAAEYKEIEIKEIKASPKSGEPYSLTLSPTQPRLIFGQAFQVYAWPRQGSTRNMGNVAPEVNHPYSNVTSSMKA